MVDKRGLWERIYGESNLKRLKKSNREKYSLAYANQNHDYATSIKQKRSRESMYEITVNAKNHRKCKKSRLSLMNATGEGPLQTLLDFLTPAATAAAAQKRENPFPQFLTISGYTFPAYFLFFYTFLVDTYSHKISFFVVYFFHDPSYSTFPF